MDKLEMIAECRLMYGMTIPEDFLLEQDAKLREILNDAQRAELFDEELVEVVDGAGWALTLGGLWIDTDGKVHYQPGEGGVHRDRDDVERDRSHLRVVP